MAAYSILPCHSAQSYSRRSHRPRRMAVANTEFYPAFSPPPTRVQVAPLSLREPPALVLDGWRRYLSSHSPADARWLRRLYDSHLASHLAAGGWLGRTLAALAGAQPR